MDIIAYRPTNTNPDICLGEASLREGFRETEVAKLYKISLIEEHCRKSVLRIQASATRSEERWRGSRAD